LSLIFGCARQVIRKFEHSRRARSITGYSCSRRRKKKSRERERKEDQKNRKTKLSKNRQKSAHQRTKGKSLSPPVSLSLSLPPPRSFSPLRFIETRILPLVERGMHGGRTSNPFRSNTPPVSSIHSSVRNRRRRCSIEHACVRACVRACARARAIMRRAGCDSA